jgi:hypothetical protein
VNPTPGLVDIAAEHSWPLFYPEGTLPPLV